jgi:hypothetical protein
LGNPAAMEGQEFNLDCNEGRQRFLPCSIGRLCDGCEDG